MEFGILLGILGLALAVWQYFRAERFQKQAEQTQARAVQTQAELQAEVLAIPNRVTAQVERLLRPQQRGAEQFEPNILRHADIDGDGENEILLEYLAPATGRILKAFDWNEKGELMEIGWLFSQQSGFEYSDVDGDGKTEIISYATPPDAEVVALAPRAKLIFKWDGLEFREITGFSWEDHRAQQTEV